MHLIVLHQVITKTNANTCLLEIIFHCIITKINISFCIFFISLLKSMPQFFFSKEKSRNFIKRGYKITFADIYLLYGQHEYILSVSVSYNSVNLQKVYKLQYKILHIMRGHSPQHRLNIKKIVSFKNGNFVINIIFLLMYSKLVVVCMSFMLSLPGTAYGTQNCQLHYVM